MFTEVIIAPAPTSAAAPSFAAKKNLRLLVTGGLAGSRRADLACKSGLGRASGAGP
jgi:phosphoribosylaminoimidazolecarboxamide formyltransferase/IMP cyclohydrolase